MSKNSQTTAPETAHANSGSATNTNATTTSATPVTPITTPKSHTGVAFKAITITLLVLALISSAASLALSIIVYTAEDAPISLNYGGSDGNSLNFTEGSIADVAAKVSPGVVSIVTETRQTSWFGQTETGTSAGTGMVVSADGYILTNKHVIEGARSISVILDDGTTYDDVTVVGTDPLNDVAFLKITGASDLTPVTLGDSKTISTGQPVIAIGNALGQFQNSITSGVISGTNRSIQAYSSDYSSSELLKDMIQTDAAINAGNSGGPLVNAAGEVIGINTATSEDADGIGFAIPISSVKGMLGNIIKNGSAARAYIGATYIEVTPDVATAYDLPVNAGAYLLNNQGSAIITDSPAAKAGLKDKDIITKINGFALGKNGSLSTIIGEYLPGDTVQLTILRDGEEHTVNITLGSYRSNTGNRSTLSR